VAFISYRTFRTKPFWLIPLTLGVLVLFMPFYGLSAGTLRIVVSIALLSMLVVGLNVPFGFGGELALGQSAIYAVGAYFAGFFAVKGFDLPITLIVAIVVAGMAGLLIGVPALRIGSWTLAMVSFFTVLLVPDIVNLLTEYTGGPGGFTGVPLPSVFGIMLGETGYFMLVIAVTIAFFALIRNFIVSRHGLALRVTHESPILAQSLGYSVRRVKLTAYLISALPAGAAGCLFAYQDGFFAPSAFGFSMTVAILAASIIGGSDSIYGALFGATVLTVLPLQLSSVAEFSLVIFGAVLVVAGLFFTGGVAGVLRTAISQRLVGRDVMPDVTARLERAGTLAELSGGNLTVRELDKSFGGNHVLRGVELTAKRGEITALIGPNGSGKTTLLNIVSGFYTPDAGTIQLDERPIMGMKAHSIAGAGISRTFQTPLVPRSMTAAEVVASARLRRSPTSAISSILRLPGARAAAHEDRHQALRILALMGMVELADHPASELSLGTRRILEVARALAANPSVVLLDEPASGLDENEVQALGEVLQRLRDGGATIVLVEHNFEMVMSIADAVNVLHLGTMIASGKPGEVRNHPDVIESYLGKAARLELGSSRSGDDG